jgi:methionyl-tRNA synthetase
MNSSVKTFYLTTAIDYPNGPPHLGHAYEKVLADAVARHLRLTGRPVYFLTGVDQHGQKVQQTAERAGVAPADYVREQTARFVSLWQRLGLSHDAWIETTDPRHVAAVQRLLQQLHDAGELYKGVYRGFYSVRQEQYVPGKERRPDGSFDPEWGEVVELEEENWYFRLRPHVPWLEKFLHAHPDTVAPESRWRNLVAAVSSGDIDDLCISRPKNRLHWGIELPFDRNFVCYVWLDALANYLTGAGWPSGSWTPGAPDFNALWPNDCNIIGKDILVPAHGIYWLTILHAAGFPDDRMPKFLVHGWWNIKSGTGASEKMSKSLGNVVDPSVLLDTFGADPLRYYLLAEMTTGQDADFSVDRLIVRNNAELANGLGNLLNRALNMTHRYCGGVLRGRDTGAEPLAATVVNGVAALPAAVASALESWQFHRALEAVWNVIDLCNRFIEQTEPFKLARDPSHAPRVDSILHHLCEALVHIACFLEPVCPRAAAAIRTQLGWEKPRHFTLNDLRWGLLPDGHRVANPQPLFPRIDPPQPPP